MILKDRQKTILEAAIRGYIKTARPIASAELLDDLDLDISPATVRSEMLKLDELGYLEQPHTSAGRVPTDRGYRFFVDHTIDPSGRTINPPKTDGRHEALSRHEREQIQNVFLHDRIEDFARECSRTISHITRTFTAIGTDDDILTDKGWSEMLDEPEFQDIEHIKQLGHLINTLDDDMQMFLEDNEEKIFIGSENPIKEARSYTMMLTHWQHPQGYNGFMAIVGPRRMNYQKNISLIRYLNSF